MEADAGGLSGSNFKWFLEMSLVEVAAFNVHSGLDGTVVMGSLMVMEMTPLDSAMKEIILEVLQAVMILVMAPTNFQMLDL